MARVLAIWCPDWPVAAAGVPATERVAVLDAGRVLAGALAARAEGVRPGQRRRQAQECCPELELIAHHPDRHPRAFQPVLVAVESLTPRIEVLRPGECAFPARGAARYHGGEATLTAKVLATVDQVLGVLGRCQVGIADGRFAASLAARHAPHPDPTARGGPSTRQLASRASPAGLASRGFAPHLASRGPPWPHVSGPKAYGHTGWPLAWTSIPARAVVHHPSSGSRLSSILPSRESTSPLSRPSRWPVSSSTVLRGWASPVRACVSRSRPSTERCWLEYGGTSRPHGRRVEEQPPTHAPCRSPPSPSVSVGSSMAG